jgi:hypothetical protein
MIGKNILKIFALIAFIIVSVTSQEAGDNAVTSQEAGDNAVTSQEAGDDKNLRSLVQLCGKNFPACPKGQSCAPTGLCQKS